MATERSPLVTRETLADESMRNISEVSRNDEFVSINVSTDLDNNTSRTIRPHRTNTMESNTSVYDPFATSMSSSPGDIHELLKNLEKSTALVRRHVTMETEDVPKRKSRALIPQWLTNYLLLITFIWQSLNIGLLEVIVRVTPQNTTLQDDLDLASNIIMTVFQFAHLILVFFISVKLVKQVIHRTASGSLLAQSYLSTVLLFAGLYTLEYRFAEYGWVIGTGTQQTIRDPLELFSRMFYLSVSTATLCGTSQVEPIIWWSSLTVSLQMLSSFVYFASILSLGVVERKRSKYDPPPGRLKSFTSKIRRCIFRED